MSLYTDAAKAKKYLRRFINAEIANHPAVKSAIKARKATVTTAANTAQANLVGVKLAGDETEIFLPYNSKFTDMDLTVGTVVSVWYNQSIKNAVVMQDGAWLKN